MAIEALEIQDCYNIIKTFERGCAYSTTEESVYAVLTPLLAGIQTQSQSIYNQMTNDESMSISSSAISSALAGTDQMANLSNMDKSNEGDPDIVSKLIGNFVPDIVGREGLAPDEIDGKAQPAGVLGNAFNSECIPCGSRLNMLQELKLGRFLDVGVQILEYYLAWLKEQLRQLQQIIQMLDNPSRFVDLCALLKFLTEFVCIPDLQRIISVLMALLSRVSFDISLSFDLIMSLVGLLVTPMLTAFTNMLQSYILLAVAPIDCIIDALQANLSKLDYNVLFKNIAALDKHIGIGAQAPVKTANIDIKVPFLGDIRVRESTTLPAASVGVNFNLLGPVGDAIKANNVADQDAVNKAAKNFNDVRSKRKDVDGSDPAAVEAWKAELSVAQKEYMNAIETQNYSVIGRMVKESEEIQQVWHSSVYTMIGLLRQGSQAVIDYFTKLMDETKKVMNAYLGGGDNMIQAQLQKLLIIQTLAFIASLIQAIQAGKADCKTSDFRVESVIPARKDLSIWTDEAGAVHIEESKNAHQQLINSILAAVGERQSRLGAVNNTAVEDTIANDKGQGYSMQTLDTLIEFTGDPIIDTQIYTTMQTLTTPRNAVFRCPLKADDETTAKINAWIRELNNGQ